MGRPKLSKEDAKGVVIGARFSSSEAKEVHQAIKQASQKKPDWVRQALLRAARQYASNTD